MEQIPPPPQEPASGLWRFLCPHAHSDITESRDGVVYMRWECGDCGVVEKFYEKRNPRDALIKHLLLQRVKQALAKTAYALGIAVLVAVVLSVVETGLGGA